MNKSNLQVRWDGMSIEPNAPAFVSVVRTISGKEYGCDYYFDDNTREITEELDWQGGNGLHANGFGAGARERAEEAIKEAVA